MKILKGYVKNRSRPEGCIAEHYMAEECVRFCSDYLKQSVGIGVRQNRNDDVQREPTADGRSISKGIVKQLPAELLEAAHRYVLFNNTEMEQYLQ